MNGGKANTVISPLLYDPRDRTFYLDTVRSMNSFISLAATSPDQTRPDRTHSLYFLLSHREAKYRKKGKRWGPILFFAPPEMQTEHFLSFLLHAGDTLTLLDRRRVEKTEGEAGKRGEGAESQRKASTSHNIKNVRRKKKLMTTATKAGKYLTRGGGDENKIKH